MEILGQEIRDDYESIVESPMISEEVKKLLPSSFNISNQKTSPLKPSGNL